MKKKKKPWPHLSLSKIKLLSLISLTFEFLFFYETTTIVFILKCYTKPYNQLKPNTHASTHIKERERIDTKTFFFDFSPLQPLNKARPSLLFSLL
jgi:hypothetical protein